MGKTIVNKYVNELDAQQVYADLCEHMSESTGAKIAAADKLNYIVNASYEPKVWTSGAHSFILHWLQQVRNYNELVPLEQRLHNAMLVLMLQKAVKNVPALRIIQTTAEITSGGTGGKVATDDFEHYKAILLSAAVQYDNQFQTRKSQPNQRLVNMTDAYTDDNIDDDYILDIDTPIEDVYEINMAKGKYGRPRFQRQQRESSTWLPIELFKSFTDEQKEMWLEFKKRLLAKKEGSASGGDAQRQVNFADEFRDAAMTEEETTKDEDGGEKQPDTDNEPTTEDTQLLDYVAGREDLDPSDLRAVVWVTYTRERNMADQVKYYVR